MVARRCRFPSIRGSGCARRGPLPMQSMGAGSRARATASHGWSDAQRYVDLPGILVQHEVVRADLAVDGHAVCLGFLNLRDRFLARDMNDVNWAALRSGHNKDRSLACPASVNAGERSSQAPMSVRR